MRDHIDARRLAALTLSLCLGGCGSGSESPTAPGSSSPAGTRMVAPNVYEIDGSVDFAISNSFSDDFLFSWSDAGGQFVDIPDPTLRLAAGATYTFQRTTEAHPFVITSAALPVQGTDGAFRRTTFDGSVIDAATLQPTAEFTADPAPTTDVIRWTPDAGSYYYTCRVILHVEMTGAIEVR